MATSPELTDLLTRWSAGDRSALDALVPRVYQELRRVARARLANERAGHSLQPSDLVHEAFLRLGGYERISWQDRAHFFAVASRVMRRVLVDRARRRNAAKRGGPGETLTLLESQAPGRSFDVDLFALDEALDRLGGLDERQCQVVEMHYFGDLTHQEIARVLGVSLSTVKRDWRVARLWLRRALTTRG